MSVEREVAAGVWLSLLITDDQSVPIGTLKLDTLCFESVHSANSIIERQPQSSDAHG